MELIGLKTTQKVSFKITWAQKGSLRLNRVHWLNIIELKGSNGLTVGLSSEVSEGLIENRLGSKMLS